jgi:hypothetical protein
MLKKELEEKIKEILNIKEISTMIKKQITRFVTELDYSYDEIYQALYFFIIIKKEKHDVKYGIGIVPYVINEAKKYFKNEEEKKKEQIKSIEKSNDIILEIKKIKKKKILEKIE